MHSRTLSLLVLFVTTFAIAQSTKLPLKVSTLNPAQPVSICIAEANVNWKAPVDVACAIPTDALYDFQLAAKDGDENSKGWDWKPCSTSPKYRCDGDLIGWSDLVLLIEGNTGMKAIQGRIVPNNGVEARGRLTVKYQVPAQTGRKKK